VVICAVRSHCSALAALAHRTQTPSGAGSAHAGGVTELPGGVAVDQVRRLVRSARRDPGGMVTVPARPYIVIPAALRHRCGLGAGDHVLLAAVPGQNIYVIRTRRILFFRSRPSLPMMLVPTAAAAIGIVLPFTGLSHVLGFTPLPATFFLVPIVLIVAYMALVDLAKALFYRAHGAWRTASGAQRTATHLRCAAGDRSPVSAAVPPPGGPVYSSRAHRAGPMVPATRWFRQERHAHERRC
jgi:AbrB family looped-hinge helix DNA binding protein